VKRESTARFGGRLGSLRHCSTDRGVMDINVGWLHPTI